MKYKFIVGIGFIGILILGTITSCGGGGLTSSRMFILRGTTTTGTTTTTGVTSLFAVTPTAPCTTSSTAVAFPADFTNIVRKDKTFTSKCAGATAENPKRIILQWTSPSGTSGFKITNTYAGYASYSGTPNTQQVVNYDTCYKSINVGLSPPGGMTAAYIAKAGITGFSCFDYNEPVDVCMQNTSFTTEGTPLDGNLIDAQSWSDQANGGWFCLTVPGAQAGNYAGWTKYFLTSDNLNLDSFNLNNFNGMTNAFVFSPQSQPNDYLPLALGLIHPKVPEFYIPGKFL